ncbi:MAG: MBL fold metallo-hydrolase [Eubacteriales bacterium]|nr:MBL fold metallo-hydrolase [Eubacteriales bacterium]
MVDKISINAHSSIRIGLDKVMYFDPFHIKEEAHDADIIFITHEHFDHFSLEDIIKIVKSETMFVMPASMKELAGKAGIPEASLLLAEPGGRYTVCGISFEAVPAYNVGKDFHPKANKWVGYIVNAGGKRIYVCGDTDAVPENRMIKCDIMIVPVGGTYTFDPAKAAEYANMLKPEIAIPSHYGDIVGDPADGLDFARRLRGGIQSRLLIR